MFENKQGFNRGLHQETLERVTQLSELKEKEGLKFRAEVKAVGPYVDEIKISRPDGKTKKEKNFFVIKRQIKVFQKLQKNIVFVVD